ncbi:vosA protein [Colletotrichum higginsianum]|nr:vosA protein [Colletotrichum higginsianum]
MAACSRCHSSSSSSSSTRRHRHNNSNNSSNSNNNSDSNSDSKYNRSIYNRSNNLNSNRKPIDPPPILELVINTRNFDRSFYGNPQHCLVDPSWFLYASLINAQEDSRQDPEMTRKALVGSTCSSLQKYKDPDHQDAGYFVFGDLSVRFEGCYKLQFHLYKMHGTEMVMCASATTEAFQVHTQRTFPGMAESTFLTRYLSEQGCRLRLRKDSRMASNRKRQLTYGIEAEHARSFAPGPSLKRRRGNDGLAATIDDNGLETQEQTEVEWWRTWEPVV